METAKKSNSKISGFSAQLHASAIEGIYSLKQMKFDQAMQQIHETSQREMVNATVAFESALQQLKATEDFLSNEGSILGSPLTKHGEVAEQMEAGIRNARNIMDGLRPSVSFENVGRLAPEDYVMDGVKVQSKFLANENSSLTAVLKHFERYQDRSMDYVIPKDQYAMIQGVKDGTLLETMNDRTAKAILEKVSELEKATGRPFNDVVKPSTLDYNEVQLDQAPEVLVKSKDEMYDRKVQKDEEIERTAKEERNRAAEAREPSFQEGAKIVGGAAAIGAVAQSALKIYEKRKSGKKMSEFDREDWTDIGVEGLKGGGKAGLTAGSIYALTNLTNLSAPFAGAVTSAMVGVTSLLLDVQDGKIEMDEFVVQGQALCFESGVVALGAALGQLIIPIPALGAIVGTLTTNFLWSFANSKMGSLEHEFRESLEREGERLDAQIEKTYRSIIKKVEDHFEHYDNLIRAAFDIEQNSAARAAASVDLARAVGVSENKILKDNNELDAFFLD